MSNNYINFFEQSIKFYEPKRFEQLNMGRYRYCWEGCGFDCPIRGRCIKIFDDKAPYLNHEEIPIIREKNPEYFI